MMVGLKIHDIFQEVMLEFWLDPESVYFKDGKLDMDKEMVLFCAGEG